MKAMILMLSIFTAAVGLAQEAPKEHVKKTPEERANNVTARMKEKLALTADQESKISAINLTYARKHQSIRENTALSKEEKKAQLDASRTSLMAEYKTVLTTEQYQKLEAMKAKHEERKANGKTAKGGKPEPSEEEL